MVSPWEIAWLGQAGSQTSQLTQSSLMRRDMQGASCRDRGVAEVSAAPRASRLLGLDEDVLGAGGLDQRLDARAVFGLADEQHVRALERVRLGAGERRSHQVGHALAVGRAEGQQVAR